MPDQNNYQFEKMPLEAGEPVFDSPWQAKTFSMAVKLHEAGIFSWNEWAEELSKHIEQHEKHSELKNNDDYYTLWQTTLESMVAKKL